MKRYAELLKELMPQINHQLRMARSYLPTIHYHVNRAGQILKRGY